MIWMAGIELAVVTCVGLMVVGVLVSLYRSATAIVKELTDLNAFLRKDQRDNPDVQRREQIARAVREALVHTRPH